MAVPEVAVEPIRPEDEFLILASDGLWDVMSSQKAVNFVRRALAASHGDLALAAKELAKEAIHREGSVDNVSVILVALNQRAF